MYKLFLFFGGGGGGGVTFNKKVGGVRRGSRLKICYSGPLFYFIFIVVLSYPPHIHVVPNEL